MRLWVAWESQHSRPDHGVTETSQPKTKPLLGMGKKAQFCLVTENRVVLSIKQGQLGVQLISSLDALYPSILQGPRDEQGDKSQVPEAEVRPCGRTRVCVFTCVRACVCVHARAVAGGTVCRGGAVWEVRLLGTRTNGKPEGSEKCLPHTAKD